MELRAYISVETGQYYRQSRKNRTQFEFRPVLRNNGLTPANKVRIITLISVSNPAIPKGFNYSIINNMVAPLASETAIGPRQERFHARIMGRYLSVSELREIRRGAKCFHTWGTVTYEDVFGGAHYTHFSFIIFVGGKRDPTVWHSTEEYNDAD